MLRELRIKNFAIVDELSVSFERGLNVITGETGAGKSVIVNVLELLLGGRASTDYIRADREEAYLEAAFEFDSPVNFDNIGIPPSDTVIIRRVISRTGRTRAYINDSPVTLNTLSSVGAMFVDIHGQHEHQSLLSTATQRAIVDAFGRLHQDVAEVAKLYNQYQEIVERLEEIQTRARERAQRIDLLEYQIREIEAAELREGEKEELIEERAILANVTNLRHLSESAALLLKEGEASVLENLARAIDSLSEMSRYDSSTEEVLKLLKDAEAILEDATFTLRDIKEKYDVDPARLDEVERRLDLIERLEKKYGEGVEGILRYREEAEKELEELKGLEDSVEDLRKERETVYNQLTELAERLSRDRRKTGKVIQERMTKILKELAFNKPVFKVNITDAELSSTGKDHVEFLFSANPGMPPKPLGKIASGGELSRVMLALKSIFAEIDSIPVLVFDEVDAGVGGKTADYVGKTIKEIAAKHQVICITHLPQIAARADYHLTVSKTVKDDKTEVVVNALEMDDRKAEIARMLSGSVTEASLRHAVELLQRCG